ncbi:MAG: carboxypeptidase regulatory-like domain-containing protein, partial [Pyrinomonadaceae bacterium]
MPPRRQIAPLPSLLVLCPLSAVVACLLLAPPPTPAQDTVTGAFLGTVTNTLTGDPVAGAEVAIVNEATGLSIPKTTDSEGRFYQGLLNPGVYRIRVSAPGFQTREVLQRLFVTRTGEVVPVPVGLVPASAVTATATPAPALTEADTDIRARINSSDARRGDAFTEEEVSLLPLGAMTVTRSFDELALLLPGVAPPPQTLGSVAGPGVGPGVGSAGQFAVNGLRSRSNNFTVDGSDNNDEDIGVRRQGFVALVPQPIESIKEYQAITLLAPAQFGRNIGAQVNAVSKSGGQETHGTVYGFFNSSQLNARNAFDTNLGNAVNPLRTATGQPVLLDGQPLNVRNQSGGEDSFTNVQSGLVLGGPLKREGLFYFVSAERQIVNATREESFAVPTIEQRGAFRGGATGIFSNPLTGEATSSIPNSSGGDAVFSLFPFLNNPNGVYGANTFTQILPASGRGTVLSAKVDGNFNLGGRQQSATGRYNFTDDRRRIPVTGSALFSSLRPRVRTQNFSFFFNSQVSAPASARPVFNQLRLSYGRTRLNFSEVRDREFLIPNSLFPGTPFLLNAPLLLNLTQPPSPGAANTGPVTYVRSTPDFATQTDEILDAVGQLVVAGFSPLGVDVFNFPQRRVNNTYQVADNLSWRVKGHSLTFGFDTRRSELNSDLPRNNRPQFVYNGAPRLILENGALRFPTAGDPNPLIRAEDLAAAGAVSSNLLTLNTRGDDANINLRYYQLNFFAQDEWRVRPALSLSYGLRYEYNTPVREVNNRIENTFADPALNLLPGLRQFIDGRTRIFDPDRNNFAPRVAFASSPDFFGRDRTTVIRAGYGVFYDQILGAVASQSRNVFPTFLTLNSGGLVRGDRDVGFDFLNLTNAVIDITDDGRFVFVTQAGSINRLNPAVPLSFLIERIQGNFPSALGATLPSRQLETPTAQHYALTLEQQLGASAVVSAAYVGTRGRHLLRFTTPNLGPGSILVPTRFRTFFDEAVTVPQFLGRNNSPARPVSGIGSVNIFETTANSRYDALQLQVRGIFRRFVQYQAAYTFSKVTDDVSDVFDLAGAPALPQNSLTFAGERGPANFDVRHRLSYNFL